MTYYLMLDDLAHKELVLTVERGRVDLAIQKEPFTEGWTKPISHLLAEDAPDVMYYNFDHRAQTNSPKLTDDYFKDTHGHILSDDLWQVLSSFKLQDHVCKELQFTHQGQVLPTRPYRYFAFTDFRPDFIDYEKSVLLPAKSYPLAPIQLVMPEELVLVSDIDVDIFKLSYVSYIASSLVISEVVKEVIEQAGCAHGLTFLPIKTAFKDYCKAWGIDYTKELVRRKPRIPGPKPS